jgi:TPR repeat protein
LLSPDIVRAGASEDCRAAFNAAVFDRGDYAEAFRLCRPLAEQGNPSAQTTLGLHVHAGPSRTSDDVEAAKWYRKAAEQGDTGIQGVLGEMYEEGRVVPQDYVLAYMWFNLAARDGNKNYRSERDDLAAKMTPDQIAEAQRLAREWKPTK